MARIETRNKSITVPVTPKEKRAWITFCNRKGKRHGTYAREVLEGFIEGRLVEVRPS